MTERLVIDAEFDAEDAEADLEATFDEAFALNRTLAEGEVTIAKWGGGDPVRAMELADWQAEKRKRILFKMARIRDVYEAKKAVLDAWLAEYEEDTLEALRFIDGLLDQYQRDFHPDEKTTRLPNAELKRRKNRDRIEWDEDAALRYQQEHYPEDVTRKLSKSALKDRLVERDGRFYDAETGEELEFVQKTPPDEPETFTVVQEVPDGD